ncbi:MAG: hypothetical protein ACOX9R_05050 [Armatimonadota bacterium]|jgi:hypothetical protein
MTGALHTTCRAALVAVALAVAMPCVPAAEPTAQGVIDSEPPPDAGPRTTTPAQIAPNRAVDATEPAEEQLGAPSEDERPATVTEPEAATAEPDWRPGPSQDTILVDADRVYYHAGATIAEGNVIVRYRDITVTSDTAEIDEDGVWGQFRGNVMIERQGQQTTAELIRINFETEQWEVIGARARLEPEWFEVGVEEPIFVRAETVSGTAEDERLDAFDGLATSCDLELPHYGLHSRHIRIVGDDRVIMERPRLEVLGNTILRLPWDLVLSQQSPNNRFFPELGQNTVEGFYAKFAYLYLTSSELNSYVRLHLTEKRGIGIGGDHYFRTGPHSGEASLFFQPSEGSMSARLRHDWEIADRLSSRLNVNLQEHSGFQSATRSLAGNLTLTHRGEMSTSTLGFDRAITDSAFASSKRFTSTLNHRQRLGGNASWDLRTVLRRSEFGSVPASEIITAHLQYQDRGEWFDWALAAEKQWETAGDRQQGFRLERLPEIIFNTDSRRLGDWTLPGGIPFRAKLTAGQLVQYPDEREVTTAAIDLGLGGERHQISDNTEMVATLNFDQGFFSDGSALYNVGGTLNINTDFGSNWHSRIAHHAATVAGFSPLRRSYGGVYDYTTLSLVQQYPNRSRFELTGGFDYVRDQWRELRLRGWLNASDRNRLELVSGYALNDSTWRPLQLRWTHAAPWDVYLALSSSYDIDDGSLSSADLEFDWRIDDRWQFAGLTRYSGYQDRLSDLSLRVTRDLHCWIASLTYDSTYDELRLNLGIKAFPFEEQDWTVGRGGARQGSFQQYYY